MQQWTPASEGYVDYQGHRVWYGTTEPIGEGRAIPLLVVHGGPGMPHDALEPLARLAVDGRQVIFYDQLGCGLSDRPEDVSIYSHELFVKEIDAIRGALGLSRVHIYGHSFGGALALQYALTAPPGLVSLIVADSFATSDGWLQGAMSLRQSMPGEVRTLLEEHEVAGTTSEAAYRQAFSTYYFKEHVCRVDVPESMGRAFAKSGSEVYRAMYGPQWFKMTGKYKGWTVVNRLGDVQVPTLVMAGRHDQCVPALSEQIHRGIPNSKLVIFEQSSHVPFIEEPELHDHVVLDFLQGVEKQAGIQGAGRA